jgi:hypothetical protein
MASSSSKRSKTLRLFVENPTGVVEYIVGVTPADHGLIVSSLVARVASGEPVKLTSESLQQALDLLVWSETHKQVFREARVVYDR